MASLVGGLFRQLKPSSGRGLFSGPGDRPAQAILQGASKKAYVFEVHRRETVSSLSEGRAVYIYARAKAPSSTAGPTNGNSAFEIGYIGRTEDLARQDAEHDRRAHFVGFAFDFVLMLRVEQEMIAAEIERDLIELHRPVLNELLCRYRGTENG